MNFKKKIAILGPIEDFGGREVEANFIIKSLQKDYEVSLISTTNISSKSFALQGLNNFNYTSLNNELLKKSITLKIIAYIGYFKGKRQKTKQNYAVNAISKALFNLKKRKTAILIETIKQVDLLFVLAQTSSEYLQEAIIYAHKNAIPIVFRTTGNITYLTSQQSGYLKLVTKYLHHSKNNANSLSLLLEHAYSIIDQTSNNENELLDIPILDKPVKVFITISRLVKTKNIDIVIKAFIKSSVETDLLYVVGDGEDLLRLKAIAKNHNNIIFTGLIENKKLNLVLEKAHCLIVSFYKLEAGPITGIEAMAAGRIILSAKTGAMSERLTNKDLFFDNTVQQLAEKILLVKNYKAQRVKKEARSNRERYLNDYSNAVISKAYRTAVDTVLKSV